MESLTIVLAVLGCFMALLFVVALIRRNNGIADIGYGIAFMVVTGTALLLSSNIVVGASVLALLVFVWGIRLATRIYRKNRGKPEDFRYKAWRDAWGTTFYVRSFFQIYMLQGAIAFVIALPVTLSILFPRVAAPVEMFVYAGCIVWILGFLFESVGDHQLDTFIQNPLNKGKIMTLGLWRYSRHPNYFGESLMWWGIAIVASSVSVYPVIVFVSPLLITFLLLKVSGVPMLEKRFAGNPEWEMYKVKTSVFIPLPVQK